MRYFYAFLFSVLCLFPNISMANQSEDVEVVFLRSSFTGGASKASLYEITDEKTIFIGIMKNKGRISYKTTAGKHTFMVVAESADFMEANFQAGHTYYSVVTPRMGAWKARFSLWPIKNDTSSQFTFDNKKIKKMLKKNKVIELTKKAQAWYEKHKNSVEKKRNKYWQTWLQKSPEDIAQRTLNPEDGLPKH